MKIGRKPKRLRVKREEKRLLETGAADKEIYDAKIELAIEMLKGNEPIEKIVKYSKLSEEEILELKKKCKINNDKN